MSDLERFRSCREWASRNEADDSGEAVDHFDRLPDPVVLVVLNRVGDVKSLGRCCLVSRRFHSLVPQVDRVIVLVDCVISDDPSTGTTTSTTTTTTSSTTHGSANSDKPRGILAQIARSFFNGLTRLFTDRSRSSSSFSSSSSQPSPGPSSSSSADVSHHSPTEVLRNFKEIKSLRIQLPAGELGVDDGVLLKWKACFGSTLDSCVILGASSVSDNSSPRSNDNSACLPVGASDDNGSIPESFYTNGSLKLRVVWTISSLIAASARHFLLQPIIAEHSMLESLDLTDTDGQGTLTMDRAQLLELRVKPVSASGSSQRTMVPALSMRLWYAAQLELPEGVVLKGATLVAIRPSEQPKEVPGGSECWVTSAFEEPYRTAARLLVKRRTYCLEMNSF